MSALFCMIYLSLSFIFIHFSGLFSFSLFSYFQPVFNNRLFDCVIVLRPMTHVFVCHPIDRLTTNIECRLPNVSTFCASSVQGLKRNKIHNSNRYAYVKIKSCLQYYYLNYLICSNSQNTLKIINT